MNEVNLIGNFTKEFEYSHTTNNIKFYSSILSVLRKSSISDDILIITQDPIPDISDALYYIHGSLRVYNTHGHSTYYVYSDFIYDVEETFLNQIELKGSVYTMSEKRKTPLNSYIKDVMLHINNDNKSFNVPLIFWNSLSDKEFSIGQIIHIKGRLQSRTYHKNDIYRKILEVSVNEII